MNMPMLRFQTFFYGELSTHLLDTLARVAFHDLQNSIRELFWKEEKMINSLFMRSLCGLLKGR